MKTKHTHGPYAISKLAGIVPEYAIYSQRDTQRDLALVRHYGSDEETKANADLMEAAPELLSELIALVEAGEEILQSNLPPLVKDSFGARFNICGARTAIAKAKGES